MTLPNVDRFYLTRQFNSLPKIPLIKPLSAGKYHDGKWSIDQLGYIHKFVSLNGIKNIGVEGNYIYGVHKSKKEYIEGYRKGMFVYASKYWGVSYSEKKRELRDDEILIYPIDSKANDSTAKQFILPEIWTVIHPEDSSATNFFSEKKYKSYLKKKGISGKMYDLDTMYAVLSQTDTLPWFPKVIKDEIINHKTR